MTARRCFQRKSHVTDWPRGWHCAAAAISAAVVAVVPAAATAQANHDVATLRAQLRERLRDPALVPDGRAAFVVTDPDVVEPALDRALKYLDLTPPLSATTRARAESSAVTYYRLALGEGAGLRALQARIEHAFAHPDVAVSHPPNTARPVVTIDLGWPPGPLSYASGRGYHVERTSDFFEGYAPSTPLIARKLADAQAAWPDAAEIRLHLRHPYYGRIADYRIVYQLHDGRGAPVYRVRTDVTRAVGLVSPIEAAVPRGDLTPFLAGQRSLFQRCAPKQLSRNRYNVSHGTDVLARECKGMQPDTPGPTAP